MPRTTYVPPPGGPSRGFAHAERGRVFDLTAYHAPTGLYVVARRSASHRVMVQTYRVGPDSTQHDTETIPYPASLPQTLGAALSYVREALDTALAIRAAA